MNTRPADAVVKAGGFGRTWMSLLSPSPGFRGSPLGKVLKCLVIACLVAVISKPLFDRFKESLDAAVQSALLQTLPLACAKGKACDRVVLVTIDDHEFRNIFKQRSPLDPAVLTALTRDLARAGPAAVIFDLDMAPASDDPAEKVARARLQDALLALGQATQGRTVLACPQGFATPAPSPQDVAWVAGFEGSPVRFASAEIDSAGLYFYPGQRPLAGVGVAGLPGTQGETFRATTSARHDCRPVAQTSASGQAIEPELIRPQRLVPLTMTQARENPERLAGKVVVVGGAYGVSDRFSLRGVPHPVYGVELHAWIASSAFEPTHKPSFTTNLWLDITVGLLTGTLFSAVWSQVLHQRSRESFARRSVFYLLFLILAVGTPTALLFAAVGLAQYNIFISIAAMIVSVVFDGILSSHDELLDERQPQAATAQQAALALAGGALGFALLLKMPDPTAEAVCAGALGLVIAFALVFAQPPGDGLPTSNTPGLMRQRDLLAAAAWLLVKVGVVVWVLLLDDSSGPLAQRLPAVALVVALLAGAVLAHRLKARSVAAGKPESQPS